MKTDWNAIVERLGEILKATLGDIEEDIIKMPCMTTDATVRQSAVVESTLKSLAEAERMAEKTEDEKIQVGDHVRFSSRQDSGEDNIVTHVEPDKTAAPADEPCEGVPYWLRPENRPSDVDEDVDDWTCPNPKCGWPQNAFERKDCVKCGTRKDGE